MFKNISSILIDDVWYKCKISFFKRNDKIYIRFNDPMIVNENTSVIEVSSLYMNYILYRLNEHKLNYKIFNLKRRWIKWRGRRVVFSIVLLLTISLFVINKYVDTGFLKELSENIWIQMVSWFLLFSVFLLFLLQKTQL